MGHGSWEILYRPIETDYHSLGFLPPSSRTELYEERDLVAKRVSLFFIPSFLCGVIRRHEDPPIGSCRGWIVIYRRWALTDCSFFSDRTRIPPVLFMVDRSRCLQPQIESNGIVSLLRQLSEKKEQSVRALDEEGGGGNEVAKIAKIRLSTGVWIHCLCGRRYLNGYALIRIGITKATAGITLAYIFRP